MPNEIINLRDIIDIWGKYWAEREGYVYDSYKEKGSRITCEVIDNNPKLESLVELLKDPKKLGATFKKNAKEYVDGIGQSSEATETGELIYKYTKTRHKKVTFSLTKGFQAGGGASIGFGVPGVGKASAGLSLQFSLAKTEVSETFDEDSTEITKELTAESGFECYLAANIKIYKLGRAVELTGEVKINYHKLNVSRVKRAANKVKKPIKKFKISELLGMLHNYRNDLTQTEKDKIQQSGIDLETAKAKLNFEVGFTHSFEIVEVAGDEIKKQYEDKKNTLLTILNNDIKCRNAAERLFSDNSVPFEKYPIPLQVVKITEAPNEVPKNFTEEDAIKFFDKKEDLQFVVIGDAGIGKTTFLNYLAYCFQKNSAKITSPIKIIFFISLRNLVEADYPRKRNMYKWFDIFLKELYRLSSGRTVTRFNDYEEARFEKELTAQRGDGEVLFLLDAYDETEIPPYLLSAFKQLLVNNVIITTRRHQYSELQNYWRPEKGFSALEIKGFEKSSLLTYVDSFYSNLMPPLKDEPTELKKYIEENGAIEKICLVPAFAEFICLVWMGLAGRRDQLKERSQLMFELVVYQMQRYLIKSNENDSFDTTSAILTKCANPLETLSNFSFCVLDEGRENYHIDDIIGKLSSGASENKDSEIIEEQLDFGFLSQVDSKNEQQGRGLFRCVHPLFSIFFTAWFLSNCLVEQISESQFDIATKKYIWDTARGKTVLAYVEKRRKKERYKDVWEIMIELLGDLSRKNAENAKACKKALKELHTIINNKLPPSIQLPIVKKHFSQICSYIVVVHKIEGRIEISPTKKLKGAICVAFFLMVLLGLFYTFSSRDSDLPNYPTNPGLRFYGEGESDGQSFDSEKTHNLKFEL